MSRRSLAVHGHFYQPARHDPFTGTVPEDPTASPARDWNSRIADECYAPNAARGNFGRIGWDLGPTLASWLRRERPAVHSSIARQERGLNGLAQGYHHSILPLASARDRRTEIRWGLRDFELRFGRRPQGIWLPETAVDLLTLRICAEEGVGYTILAPWQAASDAIETRHPHRVMVGGGRSIAVVLYDGLLSAAVSFEPAATTDADRFAERIAARLGQPMVGGRPALVVIATDGELYGHHQKFRDLFLARLTAGARSEVAGSPPPTGATAPAPAVRHGFAVTTVGEYLATQPRLRLPVTRIRERTSWSCHHGVARWSSECPDARDGSWKGPLRAALERLATRIDVLSQGRLAELGIDLWEARDRYVDVASGYLEEEAFVEGMFSRAARGAPARAPRLARAAADGPERVVGDLLAASRSRLAMFASDAWFWDDPARPETLQALRFAGHAARTVERVTGRDLEGDLLEDLAALRSPATGRTGSALYRLALESIGQRDRAAAAVGQSSREP